MSLPFAPPLEPMLAKAEDEIPRGDGWCYEPKWDGFRTLVFKSGDDVHLCSRKGLAMQRYFPEVVELCRRELKGDVILDGELIIPGPKGLDFDALQMRIHPAASRVQKLSKEIPAGFVAFDVLALGAEDLREKPFSERRVRLLELCPVRADLFPTPETKDPATALAWFKR